MNDWILGSTSRFWKVSEGQVMHNLSICQLLEGGVTQKKESQVGL